MKEPMNRKIGLDFYSVGSTPFRHSFVCQFLYDRNIFNNIGGLLYIQDVLYILFSCSLKEERNQISKCYLGTNRSC